MQIDANFSHSNESDKIIMGIIKLTRKESEKYVFDSIEIVPYFFLYFFPFLFGIFSEF